LPDLGPHIQTQGTAQAAVPFPASGHGRYQATCKETSNKIKKGYCKTIIKSPYQDDTPCAHLTSTYFGLSLAELFVLSQLHAAKSSRKAFRPTLLPVPTEIHNTVITKGGIYLNVGKIQY
jgi:ethanolamine utilization protein EutP (predicted NTPase)